MPRLSPAAVAAAAAAAFSGCVAAAALASATRSSFRGWNRSLSPDADADAAPWQSTGATRQCRSSSRAQMRGVQAATDLMAGTRACGHYYGEPMNTSCQAATEEGRLCSEEKEPSDGQDRGMHCGCDGMAPPACEL